jgi:hypothetical protein
MDHKKIIKYCETISFEILLSICTKFVLITIYSQNLKKIHYKCETQLRILWWMKITCIYKLGQIIVSW